jgi:hypothetical protein
LGTIALSCSGVIFISLPFAFIKNFFSSANPTLSLLWKKLPIIHPSVAEYPAQDSHFIYLHFSGQYI